MPKKDNLDEDGLDTLEQAPKKNAMAKIANALGLNEASTDGLVLMTKGDEKMHVHPTTVKAHLSAGWKHV